MASRSLHRLAPLVHPSSGAPVKQGYHLAHCPNFRSPLYRPRYTLGAADRIRKLHPQVKHAIRQGIKELFVSPLNGHSLQFELAGLRSYRIRTYRIIYRLNDDELCLDIVFVGPRRNVYEEKN